MNEEFDLNNAENEGKPGSLGGAFDGFSPDLPSGSWERLAERRKKRKRFLLWWWLPALLLVGGFSIWFWVKKPANEMNQSQPEVAVEQCINQPKSESSSQEKATQDREKNAGKTIDYQTELSQGLNSSNASNHKTDAESTPNSSQQLEVINDLPTPGSDSKLTKELSVGSSVKGTDSEIGLAQAQTKTRKRRDRKTVVSSPILMHQITKKPIESNPEIIHSKKSNSDRQSVAVNEDANQNQATTIFPTPSMQKTESSLEKKESEALNRVAAKSTQFRDTLPAKNTIANDSVKQKVVENKEEETLAKTDSAKKEQNEKPGIGIEFGLLGLVVNQRITVDAFPVTGTEKMVKEATQVKPMWGGNFQFKVRIPVTKRWYIFPMAEVSVLSQSVQFVEVPGQSAPVVLIKTAEGITGSPAFTGQHYWKQRWLYMPAAGVEGNYQFTERIGMRAGVSWAWIFSDTKATSPGISNPVLMAALQYQVRKRWMLRAEVRQFTLKSSALPETQSKSQNLQVGLGLVWKWK